MAGGLIVFVCTGNVCRSPMAEYLLRAHPELGAGWDVCSAGLAAVFGVPASHEAVGVMREKGIDIRAHCSRPLSAELVAAAELVVVMTADHSRMMDLLYPEAMDKVRLLKSFDEGAKRLDLRDPIGMSHDVYRGIRKEIEQALPGLLACLEDRTKSR
ncbi:MAG: low molecular weight protein arginine phosphatase [Kiritimatiellia bacterium]|nr:low molecular weight protein arginine phosphatase [Kiritimatiellia bacterium]MDP6809697.1 low molecular weight protein arginine phosphatase [Kiritimatiellia bacterium]MDP7025193.1 low molecular weight protein arginine phosphatase [Kiritimatiellia bacterium]